MTIDFSSAQSPPSLPIESVTQFKCAIVLDNKLKCDAGTDCLSTKSHQRMYFWKKFSVLMGFAGFTVFLSKSVFTFDIICWLSKSSRSPEKDFKKYSEYGTTIRHLFYVDDITLYANSETSTLWSTSQDLQLRHQHVVWTRQVWPNDIKERQNDHKWRGWTTIRQHSRCSSRWGSLLHPFRT